MHCFITRANGFVEAKLKNKQENISRIANANHFLDMAVFAYYGKGESWEERQSRFDGIIAGVTNDDVAVVQIPTGNGYEWDQAFIQHLKKYGVKIVVLLHDLNDCAPDDLKGEKNNTICTCNMADAIIVPSLDAFRIMQNEGYVRYIYLHEGWDNEDTEFWLSFSFYTLKVLNLAIESVLKMDR